MPLAAAMPLLAVGPVAPGSYTSPIDTAPVIPEVSGLRLTVATLT